MQAPHKRRVWPIVLAACGIALALFAGMGFVAVKSLVQRYESSVRRDSLLDPSARSPAARSGDRQRLVGPMNFLLIGSDKRADNPEAGQRSDSIVIVQVNRELNRAFLVSIPRDLLVAIPGYDEDKINAAFSYGGAQLLSSTLTKLTGLTFDGAAIIDFGGFKKVIDLLGGVELCVTQEVVSIHTGHVFKPGCQKMDGKAALDFSRQRYDLVDHDYDRQKHHQQLLKAIFTKAITDEVAYNPIKFDQLIRAVGDSLTVDLGGLRLTEMVYGLRELRPEGITGIRVPSYSDMFDDTAYAILTDESAGLWAALRSGGLAAWAQANPQWVNPI